MTSVISQALATLTAATLRSGAGDFSQGPETSEAFAAIMDETGEAADDRSDGRPPDDAGQTAAFSPIIPAGSTALSRQAAWGSPNSAPGDASSSNGGRGMVTDSRTPVSLSLASPAEVSEARLAVGAPSGPKVDMPVTRATPQGAASVTPKKGEATRPFGPERLASMIAPGGEDAASRADAWPILAEPADQADAADLPPQEISASVLQSGGGAGAMELRIDVSAIRTHLPPIVARSISGALGGGDTANVRLAGETRTQGPEHGALRVLKFRVEPDSLGAISVRMRVTSARVDITIDAESSATTALLADARDQLIAAMGRQGISVGVVEVAVNPASPPNNGAQHGLSSGGQSAGNWGEQGFANQSRFGESERRERSPGKTYQPERPAGGHRAGGVIL